MEVTVADLETGEPLSLPVEGPGGASLLPVRAAAVLSRLLNVANILAAYTALDSATASWGAWVVATLEFGMVVLALAYAAWAGILLGRGLTLLGQCPAHNPPVGREGDDGHPEPSRPPPILPLIRRAARAFGLLSLNALTFFPTYEMLGVLWRRMMGSGPRGGPSVSPSPLSPSRSGAPLSADLVQAQVGSPSRSPVRLALVLLVYIPVAVVALCLRLAPVSSIVGRPARTPFDWSPAEWLALAALINNLNTMGRTDAVDDAIAEYLGARATLLADTVDALVLRRHGAAALFAHRAFGLAPADRLAVLVGFVQVFDPSTGDTQK